MFIVTSSVQSLAYVNKNDLYVWSWRIRIDVNKFGVAEEWMNVMLSNHQRLKCKQVITLLIEM